MKSRNCTSVLAVLFAFCGAVDAKPPDHTLRLNLRVTEGDPTSAIDFTLTMALMIEEQDGDDIGWDVISLTIRERDANGTVLNTWYKTSPFVDTPDQLWWIEHANSMAPVNAEFLIPPRILGTATSMNPTEPSLEFDFEGAVYMVPPEGAPFENTVSLTALLQEEDNPVPEKEVEDETVEVPKIPEMPEEPYPV